MYEAMRSQYYMKWESRQWYRPLLALIVIATFLQIFPYLHVAVL